MVYTSEIQLFQILREKLGDKEAEALAGFVDTRLKENNETNLKILATKEDIVAVGKEVARVENKISETKAELIKWMFIFWIGQLASFIAIAKYILK